ncbi:hypothetical protein HaLaN_00821 [Haematococcus lacustris]|uniref:Peptidase A1 domain-containing protein n=1 Tax=Haematococcus lacustris TaxID=44745 RepID=A0A699YA50_HAELA|nr:hypothetical protein HaLaN_00821 [Haematococcus lacustris]
MLPWQRTHVVKSQQRLCSLCISCIIRCLLHCCLVAGFCSDPQIIDVGTGSSVFVPNVSTCNTASSWSCLGSNDYTYQLAAAAVDRLITVSTCVDNVAAYDTVLIAFPTQGSSCPTCPAGAVFDDEGGPCGAFRSQLTITALAGRAYTVVVEGWAIRDRDAALRGPGVTVRPATAKGVHA